MGRSDPGQPWRGVDAGRARALPGRPLADASGTRGVFVVANFLRQEREEIDHATRVGVAVYASVLVLAVAVTWLVAGRVLAPVRMVTEAAKELTESDLSRRIPIGRAHDEIAELARAFNSMLDRLERAFRNQREFLDDAGHELRTPITIIRGHVEVEGDDPDERGVTRGVVLDELDRMGRIVDDLLVLAQAEQPYAGRRSTSTCSPASCWPRPGRWPSGTGGWLPPATAWWWLIGIASPRR